MSKLQRWSLGIDLEKGFYQRHDDNGDWVDYKEAADLIEQLQQRNAELEKELERVSSINEEHFDQRNQCRKEADELAAHVERLSNTISSSSLVDDPHIMSMLNATPQQSLNALKREVALDVANAVRALNEGAVLVNVNHQWLERHANTKYPTEGE